VPGSRLIDAPPAGLTLDTIRPLAAAYDLAVLHTSTPSFAHDVRVAEALKTEKPNVAHSGSSGTRGRESTGRAIDLHGNRLRRRKRVRLNDQGSREAAAEYRTRSQFPVEWHDSAHPNRPVAENMDTLPFVVDVYKRDLVVEHYAIGYLLHPYVSLYTGRGCRSKCTFCLWPQTVGGHRYRTRSVEHVADEIALATRYFLQVREYFFDDDTLTDDLPRIEALADVSASSA